MGSAGAESCKGGKSLLLRHAAVELGGAEVEQGEEDADAVREGFLAEEDDGLRGVGGAAEVDEVGEAFFLAAGAEADEFLGQGRDGAFWGVDDEADGVVEAEPDERFDARGHGGGEEHGLAGAGDGG